MPRAVTLAAVTLLAALGLTSCGDAPRDDTPSTAQQVAAEIVQLRRDQVLQRVEVAVHNTGRQDLVVRSIRLEVDGFDLPGAVTKDSPVPAGQVVDLPVPFGKVICPAEGAPRISAPHVVLHLQTGADGEVARLAAGDGGLLQRIANRYCAVEQVQRQVDLRFADDWRLVDGPSRKELHGELLATLRGGGPREITQVAGAIMYGLVPDRPTSTPLGSLTAERPIAHIPVIAFAARCDGHTIGEIKKPYEFLVWVSGAGEDIAITPVVRAATKQALRQVCAF